MAENGYGLVRFLQVLDFFLCELYMDRTLKKEDIIFAQKSNLVRQQETQAYRQCPRD
jgi:hypothetical protein